MDISIVILNYKTSGLVKQSLKKLITCDVSFSYEIFVVDNNSNDGCDKLFKQLILPLYEPRKNIQ